MPLPKYSPRTTVRQLQLRHGRSDGSPEAQQHRPRRLGPSGEGVQLEVTLTETLRMLPSVSVAVTDENGASAGPAVKMLSIGGQPHEISATTRFGGETLVEFNEVSPLLRDGGSGTAQNSRAAIDFNKLDEFDERVVNLDARIGFATVRAVEKRRDVPGLSRRKRPERHDALAETTRYIRQLRRRHQVPTPAMLTICSGCPGRTVVRPGRFRRDRPGTSRRSSTAPIVGDRCARRGIEQPFVELVQLVEAIAQRGSCAVPEPPKSRSR